MRTSMGVVKLLPSRLFYVFLRERRQVAAAAAARTGGDRHDRRASKTFDNSRDHLLASRPSLPSFLPPSLPPSCIRHAGAKKIIREVLYIYWGACAHVERGASFRKNYQRQSIHGRFRCFSRRITLCIVSRLLAQTRNAHTGADDTHFAGRWSHVRRARGREVLMPCMAVVVRP